MNPTPYHNEPGYESERKEGDVVKYNQCITHETIRVAVCGMLEFPTCGNCMYFIFLFFISFLFYNFFYNFYNFLSFFLYFFCIFYVSLFFIK